MKKLHFLLIIVVFVFFSSCATQKNTAETAALLDAIASKNFVFIAKQVVPRDYRITQIFPNAANQIYQLNSGYYVKVTPNMLSIDLPYFGRAFQAPLDPTKGGIKLVSTNFDITQSKGKKGTININIYPRNNNDVQQIFMTVSASGYSTLGVNSYQREPINFYGIISENK